MSPTMTTGTLPFRKDKIVPEDGSWNTPPGMEAQTEKGQIGKEEALRSVKTADSCRPERERGRHLLFLGGKP